MIHYQRLEVQHSREFYNSLAQLYFREGGFQQLNFQYLGSTPQQQLQLDKLILLLKVKLPLQYLALPGRLQEWLFEVSSVRGVSLHLLDDLLISKALDALIEGTGMQDQGVFRLLIYIFNIQFNRLWTSAKAKCIQILNRNDELDEQLTLRMPNKFRGVSRLMQISRRIHQSIIEIYKNSLFSGVLNFDQFQDFFKQFLSLFQKLDLIDSTYLNASTLEEMAINHSHYNDSLVTLDDQLWKHLQDKWNITENELEFCVIEGGEHAALLRGKQNQTFLLKLNSKNQSILCNTKFILKSYKVLREFPLSDIRHFLQLKETEQKGTILSTTQPGLGDLIYKFCFSQKLSETMFQIGHCPNLAGLSCIKLPFLCEVLALKGFGVKCLETLSKDFQTKGDEKLQKIQASIVSKGKLGIGLGGAVVGQLLIPVPFVGAVIGGLIGNLIAQYRNMGFVERIKKGKFAKGCQHAQALLRKHIPFNLSKFCESLEISIEDFEKSVPSTLITKDWALVLAFVLRGVDLTLQADAKIEQLKQKEKGGWFRSKPSQAELEKIREEEDKAGTNIPEQMQEMVRFLGTCKSDLSELLDEAQQLLVKNK